MKKLSYATGMLFIILTLGGANLSVNSGCSQKNIENNIGKARDSIVRIDVTVKRKNCINTGLCGLTVISDSAGTGSIIGHEGNYTKVLTAGHMCSIDKQPLLPDGVFMFFRVTIYDGNVYKATLDKFDLRANVDLCVLKIKRVLVPALHLATNAPKIDDVYHYYGFPDMIYSKVEGQPMCIPHYEGRFFGLVNTEAGPMAAYGINATFGASGSPILDKYGKIVGLLHSVRMHRHLPQKLR